MFFRKLLLAFLVLSGSSPLFASTITISGRILSDSGEALHAAEVSVGERRTKTDRDGRFMLETETAKIYRLKFAAEDHFTMIHSFSELELSWARSTPATAAAIPDVFLVTRQEGRYLLAFGGDAMMGRRFSEPYEGDPVLVRKGHESEDSVALLRHIEPMLQLADYTSVNLETQLMQAAPEGNAPKSYVFFSPPELLNALRVSGVDYVTLGNNHTFDYLGEGLQSTLDSLKASGLGWSGAGLTEAASLQAHRTEVGGHPLSFLGYVGWAGNFSPNQVAQGSEKGGAAFGTSENIANSVGRERREGFWPIVQYHGSREYTDEPTVVTETRLKQAVDDGAIVAIGHHPHIVQGFEIYRDRLIAYSMGNFMFDQFHYATTRSYLLYVWMDGERLHRAEIVPVYLKGYIPVPATDSVRQSILRRVNELSARRGIDLGVSGGHAVIDPRRTAEPAAQAKLTVGAAGTDRSIASLQARPWNSPVEIIEIDTAAVQRVRLGSNLLPAGHLESHYLFGAPERDWIETGAQSVIEARDAPSGRQVMQLRVPAGGEPETIGMRTFEYTFEPGTPTTFVTQAKFDGPAEVTAYQQWRKRNENRLEALAEAKLRPIGRVEVQPGAWQELRFDFDSPRVTAISYRVVVHVRPLNAEKGLTSWFDDLALIEWFSPPLAPGQVPGHIAGDQASHVDLLRTSP